MTSKMKPAVGYIRMSTDKQEDSPARQRRDIEVLAQRQNFNIIAWYEDHGLTGTESLNRPEFQRLLKNAKSGRFEAILLSEQSRMSREDIFDAMMHWKILRDAGVRIVTCQRGELDFSNLGGVITAIVDQYGAREESVKLAERVVSGKKLAVSRGQKQGGAPYGYDLEVLDENGCVVRRVRATETFRRPSNWSSRLVPSKAVEQVEAVQTMFDAIAEGSSCGAVARMLNRQGIRTMFGKRFNATSVRRTVSNAVYTGQIAVGKSRRGRFRNIRDEGTVLFEDAHEPLVSKLLYKKVQVALAKRRVESKAPTPGRYLLTGLLFLNDGRRLQGFTMSHAGQKVVRRYYGLPPTQFEEFPEETNRSSFGADVIEQAVLIKLKAFLSNQRTKRAIRSEIDRRSRKVKTSTVHIEAEIEIVRSKILRGTENLALANPADVPGVSKLLSDWRLQESKLKEKLQRVHDQQGPSPEALRIIEQLDDLIERLSEADREKIAYAIKQTVNRITLRCEKRHAKSFRIIMWDGMIELRDDLGVDSFIPLLDDDIPAPGKWREVVRFIRERNDVVFYKEVCQHMGIKGSCVSRMLAQCVLSGKVKNLGHQKGWIAVPQRKDSMQR